MVSMDKGLDLKESSYRGPDLKLFVRDVSDRQGRKRPITVRSWSTIKDVKNIIQQAIHVPPTSQRLYFGALLTSGGELPNHRTLHDAGIYRSGETLLLEIKGSMNLDSAGLSSSLASSLFSQSESASDVCISSSVINSTPRMLRQVVQQARRGLAVGLKPEFVLDGSGGTYFLHDARKVKIAVFKPADEEPYAENNPRGYLKQPGQAMFLREGVTPGEACIREVAAFMLDHGGFSGVPMTTLVEARHPSFNTNGSRLKVSEGGAAIGAHSISRNSVYSPPSMKKAGSFQEFVRTECNMDDLSPSKLSIDEVHKIAILDIRLMNADRNAANLLCRRRRDNTIELVPIDHGFCLRSVADVSWMDWCWLDWPQLKEPLSDKSRNYILSLDIEADTRLLRERLNICKEALEYFRASSSILKEGVKAGLSLYDIAVMCCRNDNLGEIPSKLEVLFSMASELAYSAVENGRWHHSAASKALAEQLSPNEGSLLPAKNGSRIHKSMSSLHFPQMATIALVEFPLPSKQDMPCMPGMIQSSASDSSSDLDCEEWAANVIADVSLDKSISIMNSKVRSGSIESDTSSDSGSLGSPRGFWHTAPCSMPSSDDSDDGSVSWSPTSDHKTLHRLPTHPDFERESWNPSDGGRRMSRVKDLSMYSDSEPEPCMGLSLPDLPLSLLSRPQDGRAVSFASLVSDEFGDKFPTNALDGEDSEIIPTIKRPENVGLARSQSYSALSAQAEENKSSAQAKRLFISEEPEQYRQYFMKFVNLVIARETTAAARLTGAKS